jgi:hypothetical protein
MKKSVDLTGAVWTKSSLSDGGSNCVEVAFIHGMVAIRDSKDPSGPALAFTEGEYEAFVGGLLGGELRIP